VPTTSSAPGIDLHYDTVGDGPETLLLVCGLGAQSIGYDVELCERLGALGVRVVRFDNRDTGLSTHLHDREPDVLSAIAAAGSGGTVDAPYDLSDMARDAVAVLDAVGADRAHVVGASMGGMIAQTVAIEHPDRVASLTSIMSTTGEPDVGVPDPEVLLSLVGVLAPTEDRTARVDGMVELARIIGTGWCFDEVRARERAVQSVERADDALGVARQLTAILASGSRAADLPGVSAPTVVLHGDADRLVAHSGGVRTAELVPDAELRTLERMAHDLPPEYWSQIVDGVAAAVARAGGAG
jgi:pimeloyl-ACP methyl ester carboxylesterase